MRLSRVDSMSCDPNAIHGDESWRHEIFCRNKLSEDTAQPAHRKGFGKKRT